MTAPRVMSLAELEAAAPAPVVSSARGSMEPRSFVGDISPYADAALTAEIAKLANPPAGVWRHRQLFASGAALFELVAGGLLPDALVEAELRRSCVANGMDSPGREYEISKAISDAREAGFKNPRVAPEPVAQRNAGEGRTMPDEPADGPEVDPDRAKVAPANYTMDLGPTGKAREEAGFTWKRLDVLEAITAEPKPTDWIVPGLVAKGEAVTTNAQGGLGKTYLYLQTVIDAALGRPVLGLYPVKRPMKILWVDEEMGIEMLSNRLSRLSRGNHLTPEEMSTLAVNLDLRPQQGLSLGDKDCAAIYDKTLREGGFDLVVLDSLVALSSGKEADGRDARDFYNQSIAPYKGALGTSFLIAAHPPKQAKEAHPDAQKMTRGSIDWRNQMDRTFWIEKHSEEITEESHVLTVLLHADKQRQAGSVNGHLIVIDGPADKPVTVRSLGATGSTAAVQSIGKVNSCQHEILSRLRATSTRKLYQPHLIKTLEALGYDRTQHYYVAVNALESQGYVKVLDPIKGAPEGTGKWLQLIATDDED